MLTNATIQLGGALEFDGASSTGSGPGKTSTQPAAAGLMAVSVAPAFRTRSADPPSFLTQLFYRPCSDLAAEPLNSGAGGNGGGSLQIVVDGKLQLDGKISAEGVTGPGLNSGGGSGGSIKLSAKTISGAGVVSVEWRICEYARRRWWRRTPRSILRYQFLHRHTHGPRRCGCQLWRRGHNFREFQFHRQAACRRNSRWTMVAQPATRFCPLILLVFNFTVTGAAIVNNTNSQSLTVQNFLIGSNSTFVPLSTYPSDTITVLTNATIQAGGRFSADGESITTASGGQTLNSTGGGGGHGGYGGESLSNALGGNCHVGSG